MIQLMLYQLPKPTDVRHSVAETCGPHSFCERRLTTLLPSGWDQGKEKVYLARENRHHQNQLLSPLLLLRPSSCRLSDTEGQPLGQLGGKPFFFFCIAACQMNRMMSHVTSCVCS